MSLSAWGGIAAVVVVALGLVAMCSITSDCEAKGGILIDTPTKYVCVKAAGVEVVK